ncbi:hypothetical protein ACQUJT_20745 [Ralstonia pseudosolanacearum]
MVRKYRLSKKFNQLRSTLNPNALIDGRQLIPDGLRSNAKIICNHFIAVPGDYTANNLSLAQGQVPHGLGDDIRVSKLREIEIIKHWRKGVQCIEISERQRNFGRLLYAGVWPPRNVLSGPIESIMGAPDGPSAKMRESLAQWVTRLPRLV